MPKQKTHRGAAKRFKVTGSGRVRRGKAYRRHILTKKTTKRKRDLRRGAEVHESDMRRLKDMIPAAR
ncbi:MAG: 50S ribosomal protein L35 [Acidobacteriota bacterium]